MTTVTLPVTKEQALYLNTVARVARQYAETNERVLEDTRINGERVSKGLLPNPVRSNEVGILDKAGAQLAALEDILYYVFPFPEDPHNSQTAMAIGKEHEVTVDGYFKTAVTLGDGWILQSN